MNISFYTLGCKMNQFETQALGIMLTERGHLICNDFSEADVIVINTCTVTSVSDRKSRKAIRHLKNEHPNAKIVVCGCLSQVNPESIRAIDGVDIIAGTSDREKLVDMIDRLALEKPDSFTLDNPLKRREFEYLPSGGLEGRTRAMLKIEDGCVNFCTYCIIPYSRGPVRSMPFETVLSEALKLRKEGYREIVITGIEISSYGTDLRPRSSLSEITAALCDSLPDVRFRLGSIEPRSITEEFCVKLKNFTNLCPHFHLSMQSGCDETLLRMNRKYDTARFFESVSLLREHFKNCAVTTDMIVGFPGETDEEFRKTLKFIEKCDFSSMHIFPYSRRPGTPASSMPNQLTRAEKAQRAKLAEETASSMKNEFLSRQIGKELSVLFEQRNGDYFRGHAENYVNVYLKTSENMHNKLANVLIDGLFLDGVTGSKF